MTSLAAAFFDSSKKWFKTYQKTVYYTWEYKIKQLLLDSNSSSTLAVMFLNRLSEFSRILFILASLLAAASLIVSFCFPLGQVYANQIIQYGISLTRIKCSSHSLSLSLLCNNVIIFFGKTSSIILYQKKILIFPSHAKTMARW